jgi:hypothetical protein
MEKFGGGGAMIPNGKNRISGMNDIDDGGWGGAFCCHSAGLDLIWFGCLHEIDWLPI